MSKLVAFAACFLLVQIWVGDAFAADVCPVREGQTVTAVEVFDGPVADMAILVPDSAGARSGYWKLGYVYSAGRTVTVRCKYASGPSADVRLARRVDRCEYRTGAKGALAVTCR